ncbi:MaoC family dehydratase [Hymenobacter ruricola]|uniref:MaoC family dehydratase n=1 Tax=Hymenobacter ruricola TaxID=2791023 RepID=A0ABS0I1L3_9BACT|nr:MaoC family dehydratase [Hymenobacter ruricola]MBF9220833.1 MaoC family dehydratase [Hymenobacter ruricola]
MPLAPGDTASLSKTITDADVQQFAALSLDTNPLHLDEEYARQSRFGQRISHGMLYGALVSAVIGTRLPGPGTIYISQSFTFLKPVFREDVITATVTVTAVEAARRQAVLRTDCHNQHGTLVLTGEARVLLPASAGQ